MSDTDELLSKLDSLDRSMQRESVSPRLLWGGGGGDMDIDMSSSPRPMQLGREVCVVNKPMSLCLGQIGENKFCLSDHQFCKLASHRKKKFQMYTIECPCMFITGPLGKNKQPTAYMKPKLQIPEEMEEELVEHLLQMDSDGMEKVFGLIQGSDITTLSDFKAQCNLARTVRKKVKEVQSPARVVSRNAIIDSIDGIVRMREELKELSSAAIHTDDAISTLSDMTASDSSFSSTTASVLSLIHTTSTKLGESLALILAWAEYQGTVRGQEIKDLQEVTVGLQGMLNQLQGTLGQKRTARDAGLPHPSVWGNIIDCTARLDKAEKMFSLILDRMTAMADTIRATGQKVDSVANSVAGSLADDEVEDEDEDMEDLLGRSSAFDSGARIQGGILHPPTTSSGGGGRGGGSGFRRDGNGGGGHDGGGGGDDGGGLESGQGGGGQSDLADRLKKVEARLDNVEKTADETSDSITIDGHTFFCHEDVAAFFERHLGVGAEIKFGCFVNPYSILDSVFKKLHSEKRVPKDLKDIVSLGLRQQEVEDYLSIERNVTFPDLIGATERLKNHTYETKPHTTSAARFQALCSAKDFGNKGDDKGLYPALLKHLRQVRKERTKDIKHCLTTAPVLRVLAIFMLTETVNFLEELFSFMSQTFTSLTDSFEGDAEAWDCVCKSVEDLWLSNFLPAKADMASADISEPTLLAVLSVWCSMKLVNAAQELTTNNLAAHPDVSNSYIHFLLEHVGSKQSSGIRGAVAEVSTLKSQLVAATSEIATLKGQLASVESRVDKLINAHNTANPNKKIK